MKKQTGFCCILIIIIFIISCSKSETNSLTADFDDIHNRVWIGQDFWAIPMEDWQIYNGRIECTGERNNMRVNVLTHFIGKKKGTVKLSVRMGLLNQSETISTAGFRFGINDPEDKNVKAACYFGSGINAGISTDRYLFIEQKTVPIPEDFSYEDFSLNIDAGPSGGKYSILVSVKDVNGNSANVEENAEKINGIIALVNHYARLESFKDAPRFWFDDLNISGTKIIYRPENSFGPILWSMYTLSRNTLKLTAQMPPLSIDDNNIVQLMLKKDNKWEKIDEQNIENNAQIACFRFENWNATKDVLYRIKYQEINTNGKAENYFYDGVIRRDPVDRTLVLGGLTCQYGTGFPYSPLVKNLKIHNPDILYFSGDQIYEGNGGYNIIRFPADRAILSYLGKWYMFGWAFGDIMRNRPTICTPDDHDVFQGNLWGEGGKKIGLPDWRPYAGTSGGYVEPFEMVNVVHKTQCAHLPDPYDPTPLEQGIQPYYTDLVYGKISFAIITDRGFKSGPNKIAFWSGRQDHVKTKLPDMSVIDNPELELIGDRQKKFLENWVTDWRGANMKVLLSQTVFANIATHHGGNQMVLFADLDSGGWPKTARDNVIKIIRKAFAFHIVGDQHLPSLSQYGVDNYSDAGWCFCTPAIFVGYERRFLPNDLGWDIDPLTDNSDPNTGFYNDPFDNLHYVHAIGNPIKQPVRRPRYQHGQEKSSGYGLIHFNQIDRTIKVEAYRFLADLSIEQKDNQFPGWPYTIDQLDNYGRPASAYLPAIEVSGINNPVILIYNEKNGDLVYALRMKENKFTPKVFKNGYYTIKIGDPDKEQWETFTNIKSAPDIPDNTLEINF